VAEIGGVKKMGKFSTSWAGLGIVVDVHAGSPFGADGFIFQADLPRNSDGKPLLLNNPLRVHT
jgi:hypothetical protein